MKHFKSIIFPIVWISLLCMSLFASPALEDMAINAEYIGVVEITKVEKATVVSIRTGWNERSEDNVSRYVLEAISTIKGDTPVGGKLIMDIWEKDYLNKTIKPIKPLPVGEPVLAFLVNYKPQFGSWTLEKQEGRLAPIADFDTRPYDYYYSIRRIKEDGVIDILGKSCTVSQIRDIINVCNSAKFKELQKRARSYDRASLSNGKSQYVDKLKLYQDQYRMCPTRLVISSMRYLNEKIEKEKLFWQIKRAGLPTLLYETLFFLLFFVMGYYGKWRWTGMLFMVYIGLIILILPRNIPLVVLFSFLLPFASYGLGVLLYRAKKGTWRRDIVKDEIAQSFSEGEDEDGSYLVWEHERTIFSRTAMIMMTTLSLAGILLLIYADDMMIPSLLILIPLVIVISVLVPVLLMFNRLRYRYGCHGKGYGYGMSDSRMKFVSFLSIATGAADNSQTLTGAGLISYGIGGVRREWSSVKWCRYDDNKKIIVINHGCCKSDKLYASDRSYNALKAIAMKAIGGKCTGSKDVK